MALRVLCYNCRLQALGFQEKDGGNGSEAGKVPTHIRSDMSMACLYGCWSAVHVCWHPLFVATVAG